MGGGIVEEPPVDLSLELVIVLGVEAWDIVTGQALSRLETVPRGAERDAVPGAFAGTSPDFAI